MSLSSRCSCGRRDARDGLGAGAGRQRCGVAGRRRRRAGCGRQAAVRCAAGGRGDAGRCAGQRQASAGWCGSTCGWLQSVCPVTPISSSPDDIMSSARLEYIPVVFCPREPLIAIISPIPPIQAPWRRRAWPWARRRQGAGCWNAGIRCPPTAQQAGEKLLLLQHLIPLDRFWNGSTFAWPRMALCRHETNLSGASSLVTGIDVSQRFIFCCAGA